MLAEGAAVLQARQSEEEAKLPFWSGRLAAAKAQKIAQAPSGFRVELDLTQEHGLKKLPILDVGKEEVPVEPRNAGRIPIAFSHAVRILELPPPHILQFLELQ